MKNAILIAMLCICLIPRITSAAELTQDSHTQILMHFNNGAGSTTFTDATGRVWTSVGTPSQETTDVYAGASSGTFSGVSPYQYITTVNRTGLLPGSNPWTVEFAMKYQGTPGTRYNVFGNSPANGTLTSTTIGIYVDTNNTLTGSFSDGSTVKYVTSTVNVSDGKWHNYSVQRVGKEITMYQDDKIIGYTIFSYETFTLCSPANNWSIGESGDYPDHSFKGLLDEVRYTVGDATKFQHVDYYGFGDSITASTADGLAFGGSDAYMLQMIANHPGATAGHNLDGWGQLSSWGVSNIQYHYFNQGTFFFFFGSNDISTGMSVSDSLNNTLSMVNYVTSRGSQAIVVVPIMRTTGTGNRAYEYQRDWIAAYQSALVSQNISHVNMYDALDATPNNGAIEEANASLYVSDGVHPNTLGESKMGEMMFYYLVPSAPGNPANNTSSNQTTNTTTTSDQNTTTTDTKLASSIWIKNIALVSIIVMIFGIVIAIGALNGYIGMGAAIDYTIVLVIITVLVIIGTGMLDQFSQLTFT